MKIRQPLALNKQGRRENQEDAIWPAPGEATAASRTFVVCDGMGGHESGEVASNAVCDSISDFFKRHHEMPEMTSGDLREMLSLAYDRLVELDQASTSARRMGTTLTFLHLSSDGVICAHIGDSRIYQFRPGGEGGLARIVYKSSDHSLVNDLVRAGIITAEEALTHPRKNVIMRAMQAVDGRRDSPTVRMSNDVKAGDYFILASDGVTDAVGDAELCRIFGGSDRPDADRVEEIDRLCQTGSQDNYSLYVVAIEQGVDAEEIFDDVRDLSVVEVSSDDDSDWFASGDGLDASNCPKESEADERVVNPRGRRTYGVLLLIGLLMVILCIVGVVIGIWLS